MQFFSISEVELTDSLNRKGNAPATTEDASTSTFNFSALETVGQAAKARKTGTE